MEIIRTDRREVPNVGGKFAIRGSKPKSTGLRLSLHTFIYRNPLAPPYFSSVWTLVSIWCTLSVLVGIGFHFGAHFQFGVKIRLCLLRTLVSVWCALSVRRALSVLCERRSQFGARVQFGLHIRYSWVDYKA